MITNDDIHISTEPPFINYLEWEGLQKNYNIGKYKPIKSRFLPSGTKNIEIFRDDKHIIKGKMSGKFEDKLEFKGIEFELNQNLIGQKNYHILKIEDISGKFEIKQSINGLKYRYNSEGKKFEAELDIEHVKRDINTKKVDRLIEWFLNGPRNLFYGGSIHYTLCKKYNKKMNEPKYPIVGINHKLHNYFFDSDEVYYKQSSKSKGFILVEFQNEDGEDRYFTIQEVPDNFGPSWSKKVSIEYKKEWWIPNFEERLKINEILSFLIGRQLLSIGYSKYSKKGELIEDCVYNPQIAEGIHLHDLCGKEDISPVNTIEGNKWTENIPSYLKQLIPNYFSLRDELKLNDVLAKYWLSQAIPKEAEIIVLAASLESIVNSWHKSPKSKSKDFYLTKKEYNKLIEEEINSIQKKLEFRQSENLKDNEKKEEIKKYNKKIKTETDKLIGRIKNAHQKGINEKRRDFFEGIGLNAGKSLVEKNAIKYRNKPAHGNTLKKEEYDEMLIMTNAYRTLINRTLLKILGYDQKYIDYSQTAETVESLNDYIRHIDEPIPNPKDKKTSYKKIVIFR